MYEFVEEFEETTGIDENYDPDGDKESGYYSMAYKNEYIVYLESKLNIFYNNKDINEDNYRVIIVKNSSEIFLNKLYKLLNVSQSRDIVPLYKVGDLEPFMNKIMKNSEVLNITASEEIK